MDRLVRDTSSYCFTSGIDCGLVQFRGRPFSDTGTPLDWDYVLDVDHAS